MEQPIFQVSELISVINQTLEYAYPSVIVEGEVASFKVNKDKYIFFDLKDEGGSVNCFMMAYQLRQPIEDGMRVRVVAQPRLTAWGKFSLTARQILPVGEGSIKRAFELLRARLAKDGLFDEARKRQLPAIPARVGVIASVESAGYADFIKIITQRWGGVVIDVANVQVQGAAAAEQIIRAIDYFNQQAELPEVLVLIRGGGSADDLSVFNDEPLVRALAGSRIPTLVGVGHEVDISLCDLAADLRAATPSNAAQLLVPDKKAFAAQIRGREILLYERTSQLLKNYRRVAEEAVQFMLARLDLAMADYNRRLVRAELVLKQLDPSTVLQRGYAMVRDQQQNLIRGPAKTVKKGDVLTITLARAILTTEVTNVQRKN